MPEPLRCTTGVFVPFSTKLVSSSGRSSSRTPAQQLRTVAPVARPLLVPPLVCEELCNEERGDAPAASRVVRTPDHAATSGNFPELPGTSGLTPEVVASCQTDAEQVPCTSIALASRQQCGSIQSLCHPLSAGCITGCSLRRKNSTQRIADDRVRAVRTRVEPTVDYGSWLTGRFSRRLSSLIRRHFLGGFAVFLTWYLPRTAEKLQKVRGKQRLKNALPHSASGDWFRRRGVLLRCAEGCALKRRHSAFVGRLTPA